MSYGSLPRVAGRFKITTAIWGVVLLTEAGVQVLLAVTLSTGDFLVVSAALSTTALVALLMGTRRFLRASQPLLIPTLSWPGTRSCANEMSDGVTRQYWRNGKPQVRGTMWVHPGPCG